MAFVINNGILEKYVPEPDEVDIVIPDGVVEIGEKVFMDSGIKSVTIPSGVKVIGRGAFESCSKLTKVTLNNGLENIKAYAFHASAIIEIELPDTLNSIGIDAFSFCNISSISIPEKVKSLSKYFCQFSNRLKSINVSEKNTKYTSVDGVVFSKGKKNLIIYPCEKTNSCYTIPDGVEIIQKDAFMYSMFESVVIPESVKLIEKYAFNICFRLGHLTIPDSEIEIEDKAFYIGKKVEDITIAGKKTSMKVSADFMTSDYNFKTDAIRFIRCVTSAPDTKERLFSEIKSGGFRIPLAIYLSLEYDFPTINAYLKRNIRRAVKYLVDIEDVENLTKILDSGYVTKKNVDDLICYAVNGKNPEIQLIISKFKNDSIGFSNKNTFDKFLL